MAKKHGKKPGTKRGRTKAAANRAAKKAKRKPAKKKAAKKKPKAKRADYLVSMKASRNTIDLLKFPIHGRKGKAALEIALDRRMNPRLTVALTRAEASKIRKEYGDRVRVQLVKQRYMATLRDLAKQGGRVKLYRAVVTMVGAVCMVPDGKLVRHIRGGQAHDVSCTAAQVKAVKAECGTLLQLTPIKASKKSA